MRQKIGKGLLRTEDWLAVWLGFLIIGLVLVGLRPQMPTFKWATDGEFTATVTESKTVVEKFIKEAEVKGDAKLFTAALALKSAMDVGNRGAIQSAAKKLGDTAKTTEDPGLKKKGGDLSKKLNEAAGALASKVFSIENILKCIYIGIAFLLPSAIGISLMGGRVVAFVIGFPIVYGLAWFSQFIAGNTTINYWGLEYVIFALLIGLFISNVLGVPTWLREAIRTEYYIKTGLVILGAGILFSEILQAGAIGIVQAILVVFIVWYVCFWLAKKLRVDDELAVMLSTGVSICGVSAAIAACGAIQGDKKKLSYTISLILIVAVPMMVSGPWIAKVLKIPDIVAGAWLGGTLDTTGSVVAAGALISEVAMKVGTIVKFSQNVLIGVAAFLLSIWWTLKKGKQSGERPSVRVIWERFPKFVIGFLAASLVFSFLIDPGLVKETKGILSGLRTVWFALAFTSIGLETRFTELFKMGGGRPAIAFIGAQAFNIIWTLILAYLLFGGYIFPAPVIQ
ncbi:MAG: putative sulfate exporter family transporter [Thermodesulfobacteriota bacterium]|nr:putative sulfate exporter family transporter [Thermodesulfobacteriota bacterium]